MPSRGPVGQEPGLRRSASVQRRDGKGWRAGVGPYRAISRRPPLLVRLTITPQQRFNRISGPTRPRPGAWLGLSDRSPSYLTSSRFRSAGVSIGGMSNCTGRLRGNGATRASTSLIAATLRGPYQHEDHRLGIRVHQLERQGTRAVAGAGPFPWLSDYPLEEWSRSREPYLQSGRGRTGIVRVHSGWRNSGSTLSALSVAPAATSLIRCDASPVAARRGGSNE
jgi:hypothetical protein